METIVHSQSSDTMLDIQHLYKSFPGVVAVNDVGFQIRRGEVHVLIGENGAGNLRLSRCWPGSIQLNEEV